MNHWDELKTEGENYYFLLVEQWNWQNNGKCLFFNKSLLKHHSSQSVYVDSTPLELPMMSLEVIKLISLGGTKSNILSNLFPLHWLWWEWGPIFLIICSLIYLVLSSLSFPSSATREFLICYWKAAEDYLNATYSAWNGEPCSFSCLILFEIIYGPHFSPI